MERYQDIHPVLAQILYNRGFTDPAEARTFLAGATPFGSPFKMRGVAQAVSRIRRAIKKQELIYVYGDFDADGVTSTVLLVSVLKALGANVKPYIPHRIDEGYGLNDAALVALAHKGAKVVITVDCGIRSLHEVEVGTRAGLDMIVTDHHSVGPEVPTAAAVINPKQPGCQYGEDMLAGVGVTFKLAEALLIVSAQQDRREPPLKSEELLDLVAIGTVADLVPLDRPENRALVTRGLAQLRHARRPGLRALMEVAGLPPDRADAMSIGFTIGPRINAAGRLESAMLAYELLSTEDITAATALANQLQTLNIKRQQLTREMQEYARTLAGLDTGVNVPLIFAVDPAFQQGIVGLVAGRLTEEFYRPSIVIHRGEEESHGSCRSIAEFNITEALDQCADLLIRHGGHAQAAGFAIHNENLPTFKDQIMQIAAASLQGKDLQPSLSVDAEVPLRQADMLLYEMLRQLEPCGNAMAAPVLCTRGLRVVEAQRVGKEKEHLRLRLSDGTEMKDAIAFRFGSIADDLPPYVDIAYQLDASEWNGAVRLSLRVQDIRKAEA
jgi:single-stranded-DNA-specific exonuclease